MSPNAIYAELIRRDVRQTDVARDLGLAPSTVNNVVRGARKSRRVAERIAEIIETPFHVAFPEYVQNRRN